MQERNDTPAAALWCAALSGNDVIVRRLLAEDVDVNVWDKYGRNALTFACKAGNLNVIKTLLANGAWIDPFEDNDGFMTPLMTAAQNGRIEIVEYLLDQGANPTLHGGLSRATAEHYARVDSPMLAAILRRAEDKWWMSHPR